MRSSDADRHYTKRKSTKDDQVSFEKALKDVGHFREKKKKKELVLVLVLVIAYLRETTARI